MSYIRSTSNPEGLYIFGDGEQIFIRHSRGTTCVPPRDFERVGLKYLESGSLRPIKSGGLSLRSVDLFRGTERICPRGHVERCVTSRLRGSKKECAHDPRMLLEYRGTKIFLWQVTWDAVARSIRDHANLDELASEAQKHGLGY
jgi:hypothetical protein